MSSEALIETFGYGLLFPAVISFGCVWLLRWVLPPDVSARYALAVGFASGFCAGYVLLPDWAELWPSRHWHWLLYLAAAAALLGPLALAGGLRSPERWLLQLLLSFAAAWLLVPDWPSLVPPKAVYLPALGGGLFLLQALLDPLPARVSGARIPLLLCLMAFCVAGMAAAAVSVSYGRLAGLAAGALLGVAAAACLRANSCEVRGLLAPFTLVVGGVAFIVCIEPRQPLFGFLVLPAAPLALWLCAAGPLRRATGIRGIVLRGLAVLSPLAGGIAWVLATT